VNEYRELFQIIEIYSPLIPLLVFFLKKPGKAVWTKLLVIYWLVYISLVYSATHFFSGGGNNHIMYIILFGLTFCFFSLILEQFLPQKFKIINRIIIIIIVLFFFINAIWGEGISIFNSYSSAVANLILVAYCVYYYKLQLEKPQISLVEKIPSFWIVSGIFIYSAGNTFLFSVFSTLARNNPHNITYDLWDINILLTLIMNIIFAKGIQCTSQK
jgi:hypothetical protein